MDKKKNENLSSITLEALVESEVIDNVVKARPCPEIYY